jgi:hypothetical protein
MGRALQLILAVLVLSIPAAASGEAIRLFTTEIHLETEDAFTVVEEISYDFGHERRHGIFREIPVRYGRGRAADYRISLDVESVTDETGAAQPYEISTRGRNLRIRIGDPKREVTATKSYVIRYRVERGILYFDDHDELYWNATGTDWPVPIDRAETVVFLPEGAPLELMAFNCFTGPMGSVASDCVDRASDGIVSFATDRPLRGKEGLTIAVWLPKGVLVEPTALEKLLSRIGDYLSLWTLLPLGTLLALFYMWHSRGRDPGGRDAIPVAYQPPDGMTPAELGTVVDERVDIEDITSSILDLAVRGFLEIEEIESTKFLFFSDRDWALLKKREADSSLRPHERLLLSHLFSTGSRVTISSLKEKFYKHLPELRSSLYKQLSGARGYFPVSPDRVRKGYAVAGGLLLGLGLGRSPCCSRASCPAAPGAGERSTRRFSDSRSSWRGWMRIGSSGWEVLRWGSSSRCSPTPSFSESPTRGPTPSPASTPSLRAGTTPPDTPMASRRASSSVTWDALSAPWGRRCVPHRSRADPEAAGSAVASAEAASAAVAAEAGESTRALHPPARELLGTALRAWGVPSCAPWTRSSRWPRGISSAEA